MANEKRLDLIDRNALLEEQRIMYHYSRIENAPTVDAVEVVRCKDCEKGHSELAPNGGVWCAKWNHVFGDDGYCSYGERKDNG